MKSWNADVIVLARVLIDDLGEITVNLALIGALIGAIVVANTYLTNNDCRWQGYQ